MHLDLIVLGAGSGGLAVAQRAARHGARVALLEPAQLGGTCVHRGCVPKKALWLAAQWAGAQQDAHAVGFDVAPGELDWPRFVQRRRDYVAAIERGYVRRLQEAGVRWYPQAGRFGSADTVELDDGQLLKAPRIVIATGARPRRPDLPGGTLGMVSDDLFDLQKLPRRLVIVGGGYVATEFACLLRALGSEVELLVRDHLLQGFESDLVDELIRQMRGQGIHVSLNSAVRSVRQEASGLVLEHVDGSERKPCDALLWAVGREPNTERLALDAAGVTVDSKGHVLTDEWQNTAVPGIYALGDVTTRKALTPVAVAAGRRLADRLFSADAQARLDYENIPSVVFARPPLGTVGMTEAQARDQFGEQVAVHRHRFTPMAAALSGRDAPSVMKLVCVGEAERVVGIHVLGTGADEMLQGFAVALKLGVHKRDLDATVAIHPSSAEELVLMA